MNQPSSLDSRLASYSAGNAASRTLERRKARLLAGCLLTAGAAGAGLPAAEGAIQYTNPADETISAALHPAANPFLINIAGANRFKAYYSAYLANGPSFVDLNVAAGDAIAQQAAGVYYLQNFAAGQTIGAGALWYGGFLKICGSGGAGYFDGVTGYAGLRFNPGAGTRYGWLKFTGAANGLSGVVESWAYQDNGNSIRAGEAQ